MDDPRRERAGLMRVLVSAESFVPEVNGVTNSVLRVVEHLGRRGHDVVVVAAAPGPSEVDGTPVVRVPGATVPRYRSLTVGLVGRDRIDEILRHYRPDLVHLAAPVVLGSSVAASARRAGIPSVAVFQTNLSGFLAEYGLGRLARPAWSWIGRVHAMAQLTLVPSTAAAFDLRRRGIGPVAIWGRGVDADRFRPERRSRARIAGLGVDPGERIVGYVGRLAADKRVQDLAPLASLRSARLVLVGDGPARRRLERQMPRARFLGFHDGLELAELMASLDVFVHAGPHETFCQAIQEAMASGVPVVAPACGGPLDLVQHGRTGFLFPPEHPELIGPPTETLLGDDLLRQRMGAAARGAVVDRTWSAIGDELLDHYARVVDRRTPARTAA